MGETVHEVAARLVDLAAGRAPRLGDTRLVLVDGRSGSGKSLLAEAIEHRLTAASAGPPTVISMEDLYPGWDGLAAAGRRLYDEVIGPLSRSRRAAFREWDWQAGELGARRDVEPTPWLLVDGSGCATGPVRRHAVATCWVDADPAIRQRRALTRDGDLYRLHWQRWADQELARLATDPVPQEADLVVDTSDGSWRVGELAPWSPRT